MPFDRIFTQLVVSPSQPFTTAGQSPAGLGVVVAGDYRATNTFIRLRLSLADGDTAPTPAGMIPSGSILTLNGFEYEIENDLRFDGASSGRLPESGIPVNLLYRVPDSLSVTGRRMVVNDVQDSALASVRSSRALASYLNAIGRASVTLTDPSMDAIVFDMYPHIALLGARYAIADGVGDGIVSSGQYPFNAFFLRGNFTNRFIRRAAMVVDAAGAAPLANPEDTPLGPPVEALPVGECVIELGSPLVGPVADGTAGSLGMISGRSSFFGRIAAEVAADEIIIDEDVTRLGTKVTLDVRLPYRTQISPTERLLHAGKVYDIEAVRPGIGRDREVRVSATRLETIQSTEATSGVDV